MNRPHALEELVQWLQEHKTRTGLSFRQLAALTEYDAATLQRAVNARRVPREGVVVAFARACGADVQRAKELHLAARVESLRSARGGTFPAPLPALVRDFADLSAAMKNLYEKAGAPPLREMEQRAGEYGVLPRSTLNRVLRKTGVPRRRDQFEGFLRACQLPTDERAVWLAAWERVHNNQPDASSPALVKTLEDLRTALQAVHCEAGEPSPSVLERAAKKKSQTLPQHFVAGLISDQLLPASKPYLRAFLTACAVSPDDWPLWNTAWNRAWRHERERIREQRAAGERDRAEKQRQANLQRHAGDSPLEPRRVKIDRSAYPQHESTLLGREALRQAAPDPHRDPLSQMLGKNRATILRAIYVHEGCDAVTLQQLVQLMPGGSSWHAEKLTEAGLVTTVMHDGTARYAATPLAIRMIKESESIPPKPDPTTAAHTA
jgi:hypothetical protein